MGPNFPPLEMLRAALDGDYHAVTSNPDWNAKGPVLASEKRLFSEVSPARDAWSSDSVRVKGVSRRGRVVELRLSR